MIVCLDSHFLDGHQWRTGGVEAASERNVLEHASGMRKIRPVNLGHFYFAGPLFLDRLDDLLRRKGPVKCQNYSADAQYRQNDDAGRDQPAPGFCWIFMHDSVPRKPFMWLSGRSMTRLMPRIYPAN